ncbi:MAG: GHKL domain-containing protein [Lachnospiraceae bacterium]
MLGVKYRYTYLWFYLGTWLYGHANVYFRITGTVWGNMIYLCTCAFALNSLLFHGSIIKRSFFTLWMYGIREVASGIFLTLFLAAAVLSGREDCFDVILRADDLMASIVPFLMMEILKRKCHLLKRDFEDRDGIYLMCIIGFICVAVSMTAMTFYRVSNWDSEYIYAVVIPSGLIAVGGEILNVYCIIMLERRLVERVAKQQYRMLRQHLEVSKEQYEQFIKIRHDVKNHSLCLAQLLEKGNTEEARHYLEQWNTGMEEGEDVVRTGSLFADALLNPKYRQAKKLGIDISIQMRVPEEETIAPVDLCCLLANAIDNAIEACQRGMLAGYPAGWIRMKSQIYPKYWVFEISNSTYLSVRRREGRFLSSKDVPICGVGLQNIRTVVERYEGVLDLKSGTCFMLNVMFPLP